MLTVRETSPSEWRTGLADAALISHSYADGASVEASGLKTVFERRVRLTVLRATGLAQVKTSGGAYSSAWLSPQYLLLLTSEGQQLFELEHLGVEN